MESQASLVGLDSLETQVYLEIKEKEVCQERKEREDPLEIVSEDKEAFLDHQGHQESRERDPRVHLAPVALGVLLVARVTQG